MNSTKRAVIKGVYFLLLMLTLGATGSQPSTGQPLGASYTVAVMTDLGPEERVSLDIQLTNGGDKAILITKISLRGFPHLGASAEQPLSVSVEPHGSSSFTTEFTVSKKEFELWSRGARPHLSLGVQIGGSDETTLTVALLRRPA